MSSRFEGLGWWWGRGVDMCAGIGVVGEREPGNCRLSYDGS